MNPTCDIKDEHAVITINLDAMKKLALDMRIGKFIDSYRIVESIDFIHTFREICHYEKEEKCLYPALLDHELPWTTETLNDLISEHKLACRYLQEIDTLFQQYLSGNTQVIASLSLIMIKYVEIEKKHIRIVDTVVLPLCDKIFDNAKLKSVSFEFKKIQDHNIGNLKHKEYYKLLEMLHEDNKAISDSVSQ